MAGVAGTLQLQWVLICRLSIIQPTRPYTKYTFNNGQLTHMHAVSSSFHSKASTWKTKLLYLCAWHAPAKHLENTQWGAFSLTPSFFLFLNCQNPPFFTLMTMFSRQQHWWLMDNFGFDNSIDDWQAKYFHCSLHYACATGFIKQHTLIVLCIQYSCIHKVKHTTISHGCYAGVQFIPATSLVRFGAWVTAIDRFHCTMIIYTLTSEITMCAYHGCVRKASYSASSVIFFSIIFYALSKGYTK